MVPATMALHTAGARANVAENLAISKPCSQTLSRDGSVMGI